MRLAAPFDAPYHPARPYLLQKGLFGLLAFDLWLVMIEHGGRYGMGGFNVAHFAVLDLVLPLPTPSFYVGSLLLCGLAALTFALLGAPRWAKALLCLTYTLSWASSLHDSYQHHYLLSWLLAWTVFMPDVPADAVARRHGSLVRGWGLPMTAITCAIVYTFTGIAKSEPAWRSGAVLMQLSKSKPIGDPHPGVLDPLRDALVRLLGIDGELAFHLIALSVIALQACVAVGYLASLGRDERPSRVRLALTSLAWFCAWSFHAFAELGDMFDIGWFSYYMLWISFVLLAPAAWVAAVARVLSLPGAWLAQRMAMREPASSGVVLAQIAVSVGLVVLVGARLDLPGSGWATQTFAALASTTCVVALARGWVLSAQKLALTTALTAALAWVSITSGSVRFDYYRLAAGESYDMGALEDALALYEKAERYAPRGKSRAERIEEIRSELKRR